MENFPRFSWLLLFGSDGFVSGQQRPSLFPSPWLFNMFPLLLPPHHDLSHGTHAPEALFTAGSIITFYHLFVISFPILVCSLSVIFFPSSYFCMCIFGNCEEQGRSYVLNTLVLTGTFRHTWARMHFLFGLQRKSFRLGRLGIIPTQS